MVYRNQYLIVPGEKKIESTTLEAVDFDEYTIYAHPSLNVSRVKYGATQIALLGIAINPLYPYDSNEDIIAKLAERCSTTSDFFRENRILSGRYVMLFKTETEFIVAGDACHLRQINYGFEDAKVVLTSSLKLSLDSFKYDLEISAEKKILVNSDLFKEKESTWYGDESIDDRFHKLLPNHYLDILKKEKKRIPIFGNKFSDENEIREFASLILRNSFLTLANRYQLIQPLTAGLDSRILLAASKAVKDKIKYYVFDPMAKNAPDVWVPLQLSQKLGINFKVTTPVELRDDFMEKYHKAHFFPRILPKTAHIQSHYDADYPFHVVNVNGNCAEIARFVYGSSGKNISFEMLLTFSKYQGKIPYFKEQLRKWYNSAVPFAQEYGISVSDLFYWENRIGNWHALWQHEQDLGVEEISPFNNRRLIDAFLQVKPEKRKSPDYTFYKDLARHLWPEVVSAPINPGGNRIKKIIHGNSTLKYLSLKAKYFLNRRK